MIKMTNKNLEGKVDDGKTTDIGTLWGDILNKEKVERRRKRNKFIRKAGISIAGVLLAGFLGWQGISYFDKVNHEKNLSRLDHYTQQLVSFEQSNSYLPIERSINDFLLTINEEDNDMFSDLKSRANQFYSQNFLIKVEREKRVIRLNQYESDFSSVAKLKDDAGKKRGFEPLVSALSKESHPDFSSLKKKVSSYYDATVSRVAVAERTTKLNNYTSDFNSIKNLRDPATALKKLGVLKTNLDKEPNNQFTNLKREVNNYKDNFLIPRKNAIEKAASLKAGIQRSYNEANKELASLNSKYSETKAAWSSFYEVKRINFSNNYFLSRSDRILKMFRQLDVDIGTVITSDKSDNLRSLEERVDNALFDLEYMNGITIPKQIIAKSLGYQSKKYYVLEGVDMMSRLDEIGSESLAIMRTSWDSKGKVVGKYSIRSDLVPHFDASPSEESRQYYSRVISLYKKKLAEFENYNYDSDVKERLMAITKKELQMYRVCLMNATKRKTHRIDSFYDPSISKLETDNYFRD